MIRVADYILSRIQEEGVQHLFYVPGGQCVYLMDALRRNQNIEGIATHHEQAAAMAALAYGMYTENLGACLVTTGCAGTNTMTGLLHAWQDSIPCIFVSGQQNVEQTIASSGLPLRQVGIQEADIVTLIRPITKYAVMLTKPEEVAWQMDKAIYLAKHGRKGPVWIDVPLNVQNAMIEESKLERYVPEDDNIPGPSKEDLDYCIQSINDAKRPVILAGHGVRSAGATEALKEFAHKNRIPVLFSRMAADLLDDKDELNFGVVSSVGANRWANFAVQNSDLVINIGNRLAIDTTGPQQQDFAREARMIVVDIDEVEHSKQGVPIDHFVLSDAKVFLDAMNREIIKQTDETWIDTCRHWKAIFPPYGEEVKEKERLDFKYFMENLAMIMPENSTVLSDAGMTGAAVPAICHLKESDRLIHSFAQGEMGFVLPGAIGVAPVCLGMVFAVTGDGSLMMNLQELQTLVRNDFNVKIIINNNNGYSGVRHGQKAHFRGKSIGTDPSNGIDFPDYGKVAVAFGIAYDKIENTAQMEEKLEQMFQTDKPYILEVMCDPDQFDLHNALVMYGKRKFGFRPIEDQSPFIDRDVFFEEMLVKPMETSYGKPV